MKNMTLKNIGEACQGQLICEAGQEQLEIKGAVLDSRLVEEGYLFFATKGERVDGHSFIAQVAEKNPEKTRQTNIIIRSIIIKTADCVAFAV